MPPSPAGGRKWRVCSRGPVGGGVPTPRQQRRDFLKRSANPQPPRCRARRPRRAGQELPRFPQLRANSHSFPCREGACPFRQGMPRYMPTLGEFASVQRIRPGFPHVGPCAARKGQAISLQWRLRIRRGIVENQVLLRGAPRSARPTGGGLRIRLTGCFGSVLLRGTPGTAFPTEGVRIRRR